MAQPRFFKKGRKFFAQLAREGNFTLLDDGKWYHKDKMEGFREVSREEYEKGKGSGDEGVGPGENASKSGAAASPARKRARPDVSNNDGEGQDAEGEAGPADASGAEGD